MKNVWAVSRQSYVFVEEPLVVEIAFGGFDYTNPDMLSDANGSPYHALGSCMEYADPREALEAAFAVRALWIKNLPSHADCQPRIEVGFTDGATMPFGEYPDDDWLKQWAQERYDKLPKCDECGDIIETEWYNIDLPDYVYCSAQCGEESHWKYTTENEGEYDD